MLKYYLKMIKIAITIIIIIITVIVMVYMFPQINAIMWRSESMLYERTRGISQYALMNYPLSIAALVLRCDLHCTIVVYKATGSHQCVALTTSDNAAPGSWQDREDTGVS